MSDDVIIRHLDEVDQDELHAFLERFFGERKAGFLLRHGAWWHGGGENRRVATVDGGIAGYCALIATRCRIAGRVRPAWWWMDLVVAPEFRGRGVQHAIDVEVRRRAELLLGFPNELAARIHKKHGWGVREDLTALLAPLDPPRLGAVRRASGVRGGLLRTAARGLRPAGVLWRRRLAAYRPRSARRVEDPDAGVLAEVAERFADARTASAVRDADHLSWRYLEAPYRGELRFYVAGDPSVVLVSRRLERQGTVEERVLDLFGDPALMPDVVRFALAEAVRAGAAQMTALASHRELANAWRRLGFLPGSTGRFCWWSEDRETMEALADARLDWGLGDSDNDEPV